MRRLLHRIALLWIALLLPITLLITWQRQGEPVNQLIYVYDSFNAAGYYHVRLDTLKRRPFGPGVRYSTLYFPPGESTLSPDKQQRVMVDPMGYQKAIVTIRPMDAYDPAVMVEIPGYPYSPVWSPDGAWIAFHLVDYDVNWTADLYRVQADGTQPEKLTDTADYSEEIPLWSPDGQWLIFIKRLIGGDPHVFIMRPNGTELQQISETPATMPAWSPDSQSIAYSGYRGSGEIYLAKLDGTGETLLTDTPGYDSNPLWSPDGEWIAFLSDLGTDSDIYALRLSDRKLVTIAATDDVETNPQWMIPADMRWQPLYLLIGGSVALMVLNTGNFMKPVMIGQ